MSKKEGAASSWNDSDKSKLRAYRESPGLKFAAFEPLHYLCLFLKSFQWNTALM
jgi:hypothetical protein